MKRAVAYRENSPDVISEVIDGEVVVVSFESGRYFSCRGVSAWVWTELARGVAVDALLSELTTLEGLPRDRAASALDGFLADLLAEGLLRVAGPEEAAASPAAPPPEDVAFDALVVERFDEMKEMLLYDPIHDVDETGWPNRPATAVPEPSPPADGPGNR